MLKPLAALALAAALAGPPTLLDRLWSLAGCIMDPDGGCLAAPQNDAGCRMDPNGGCLAAPRSDEGCIMDPNGACRPAPGTDAGLGMDPDG